jgi:hypothetical protein
MRQECQNNSFFLFLEFDRLSALPFFMPMTSQKMQQEPNLFYLRGAYKSVCESHWDETL